MAAAASLGEELLEREPELARLRAFIASAAAGEGRVLLVDGEAGIGKSAILRVARDLAEVAGLTVLFARGGKLERGFAHGVARQLYEPAVHPALARRRRALLRGAAGLAAPVLGLPAGSHGPSLAGDPAFAANHGLYWLTANLAEEQPLVLLVDDAHWADSATLLFLNYLGRRLELAHAFVELGAALRRTNKRADAREPLRAGMELAHRCAALPLAERARQELRATGARPRRLVFTGLDSLTAQERRVAEMAAEGLSNPEIAQALFVTRRTIETHLGHVYRKLDLASRDQLAAALWTRNSTGRSRGNGSPRPTANPRARTPP